MRAVLHQDPSLVELRIGSNEFTHAFDDTHGIQPAPEKQETCSEVRHTRLQIGLSSHLSEQQLRLLEVFGVQTFFNDTQLEGSEGAVLVHRSSLWPDSSQNSNDCRHSRGYSLARRFASKRGARPTSYKQVGAARDGLVRHSERAQVMRLQIEPQ